MRRIGNENRPVCLYQADHLIFLKPELYGTMQVDAFRCFVARNQEKNIGKLRLHIPFQEHSPIILSSPQVSQRVVLNFADFVFLALPSSPTYRSVENPVFC